MIEKGIFEPKLSYDYPPYSNYTNIFYANHIPTFDCKNKIY